MYSIHTPVGCSWLVDSAVKTMVAWVLFGLISFAWLVVGIIMAVLPEAWLAFLNRLTGDAWRRFWVSQGMLLGGLVLAIGTTTFQGFWLWVICGYSLCGQACLLLGLSETFGIRLMQIMNRWPYWVHRCCGVVVLILAVLLSTDAILHG